VILFVGRLSEEKGILSFIAMLDLIRDSRWLAEIVGEGPQEREARRLIEALGLGGRVLLRGPVAFDELDEYYRRCSVVVVPSVIPENFALVGLESLVKRNDLADHQQIAQVRPRDTRYATRRLKRCRQVRLRRLDCRRQPKCNASNQRNQKHVSENCCIRREVDIETCLRNHRQQDRGQTDCEK